MNRYLLYLEYLGKNYKGSQKQPNGKTIQGEIEKALCTLTKQKISTIFSGRTDALVSAKAQTLHFDCDIELEKNKFLNSINGILPCDIRVFDIKKVDNTFHAQKSATYRHYRYKIRNDIIKSVFDVDAYPVKYFLDDKRMNSAIKYLQGEYDFSAFKSQSDNPAKVCKIYLAEVNRSLDGKYIIIDIVGNRFLYNMVRTIVGTLLMIEKDNLAPLAMDEILKSKKRENAGMTASPEGLVLLKVGYDDCLDYLNKIHKERQINENI